jgi:copper transport protein
VGAILARAAVFVCITALTGAVSFRFFVRGPAAIVAPDVRRVDAIIAGTLVAVTVALIVLIPLRVSLQAMAFAGDGESWTTKVMPVLRTTWGIAAFSQVYLVGFLIQGQKDVRRNLRRGWFEVALFAFGIVVAAAFMGHAAADRHEARAIIVDVAHQLAIGAWVGGLGILTLFAVRARRTPEEAITTVALVEAFHEVATFCVGTMVVTGVVAAILRLNSPLDLVRSTYGQLLSVKLGLVAVALLLGWRHSKVAAARARAGGSVAIAPSLAAEWVVLMLVLLVTAVLTASSPPTAN